MKTFSLLLLLLAASLGIPVGLQAQTPAPAEAPAAEPSSQAELDSWLGPIALYPDPLLAQVLSASTQPSEVVLAHQYLTSGGNTNLVDAQPWSPSVKALAHYPGILQMMVDYFAWTKALGQAYLYHEPELMDEIQRLRSIAWDLGNLESTPEENVIDENGAIEILPAESDVIYIPQYESDVVYAQPVGPPCISFGPPCPMGFWMDRDFDWHHHQCLAWDHRHQRPADWWSSRHPSPPAPAQPSYFIHANAPAENPRTQPTRFILWQVPQVRVVGAGTPAGQGSRSPELRPHHIEHLASAKPSGSSVFVMPNRGAVPAARSAKGGSAIQVFSSDRPVQTEEVSGGHHVSDAVTRIGGAHGAQHLSQPDQASHMAGPQSHRASSASHEASSHVTSTQHTSGGSHTPSSAPAQTSSHSGGASHMAPSAPAQTASHSSGGSSHR